MIVTLDCRHTTQGSTECHIPGDWGLLARWVLKNDQNFAGPALSRSVLFLLHCKLYELSIESLFLRNFVAVTLGKPDYVCSIHTVAMLPPIRYV